MMRRTLVLAMLMLGTLAVMASPGINSEKHDLFRNSIEIKEDPKPLKHDTGTVADSDLTSRNLIFKHRLDSIQKKVPLTYNSYVQEYIDIYMSRQGQIGKMLGLSKYYFPIYEKAFHDNDIPQEIKFLSIVESSLDPQAVSRSGATGLWQFMTSTAKVYGLNIDSYSDERKDPVAASNAATRYFKESFAEFGDWLLAIASYNCGTGAVSRAIAKAGGVKDFWAIRDYLPVQAQNYVPAFIATTYIMNYYTLHGIFPAEADFPTQTNVIQVNRFVSLENIAKAIDVDVQKLYMLNPSYKKKIINGTPEKPKPLIIPVSDHRVYNGLYNALNTEEVPTVTEEKVSSVSKHARLAAPVYHKVKKGENLSIIASRYGVEVLDLKAWNKLKNLQIKPGQVLKVSADKSA
jgi:membrane-bound lytic murein transglycosylase D